MTNAGTNDKPATVAEQGAHGASGFAEMLLTDDVLLVNAQSDRRRRGGNAHAASFNSAVRSEAARCGDVPRSSGRAGCSGARRVCGTGTACRPRRSSRRPTKRVGSACLFVATLHRCVRELFVTFPEAVRPDLQRKGGSHV